MPSSSPPALLRRARRSGSRRRAPRRRHARFQEIIGVDFTSFPKVSTASSSCDARSARSLALAMHPATSRRRPRERKVSRLPRRKSPLHQVCQNLQTLMHLMVHCLLLAPRRAASSKRAAPPSCIAPSSPPHLRLAQRARGDGPDVGSGETAMMNVCASPFIMPPPTPPPLPQSPSSPPSPPLTLPLAWRALS